MDERAVKIPRWQDVFLFFGVGAGYIVAKKMYMP